MPGKIAGETKQITIYDIAREAGVSASTVSRTLSGSSKVSAGTKQKIMALVQKYNFRPNALAQGLAESRSRLIGIVVADIRNPYYAELFFYCAKAAQEAGYTVMVFDQMNQVWEGRVTAQVQLLEKMLTLQMDAVILIDAMVTNLVPAIEYVDEVNRLLNYIPVIITGRMEGTRCQVVRVDHMKTMELLMDHLIGLGHRRIALVGGYMDVLATYEKAMQYRRMLRNHGILYDPGLVSAEGDYDEDAGYSLMGRLLDEGRKMTAVIAVNDLVATGVIRCLMERGYRIPEDVSVVGGDNTNIAKVMIPRITSIDYNFEKMGEILVETALKAIRGEKDSMLKIIEPVLVCGDSSGKAPDSPV